MITFLLTTVELPSGQVVTVCQCKVNSPTEQEKETANLIAAHLAKISEIADGNKLVKLHPSPDMPFGTSRN